MRPGTDYHSGANPISPREAWQDAVNLAANATQLKEESAHARFGSRRSIDVSAAIQSGRDLMLAVAGEDNAVARQEFLPGRRLKLSSKVTTLTPTENGSNEDGIWKRNKEGEWEHFRSTTRRSTGRVEVVGVVTPDKDTLARLQRRSVYEDSSMGDVVSATLLDKTDGTISSIDPPMTEAEITLVRPPVKSHERNLQLLRMVSSGMVTKPLRSLLSGDFVRHETGEHRREGRDDSQNEAYDMAMSGNPLVFIQGPPGTGKTTVLCDIAQDLAKQGKKVLVVSHSNRGVDVPAIQLQDRRTRVFRAGNDWQVIDPKVRKSRIRKGVSFPEQEIQRINALSDEAAFAETTKLGFPAPSADHARKNLRELAAQKYETKVREAKARFDRGMEKGGVTFSTFGTLINDGILSKTQFDVVLIDEATRASMEHVLLAGQYASEQLIMIGDPRQLGNIPLQPSEKAELGQRLVYALLENGLDEFSDIPKEVSRRTMSTRAKIHGVYDRETPKWAAELIANPPFGYDADRVQEVIGMVMEAIELYEKGPFTSAIEGPARESENFPYVFLNQNRRSLPAIVKVLSGLIYEGKLQPAREADETLGDGIVQWVDTRALGAHESTSGTSKKNGLEADIVVQMILDRAFEPEFDPNNLAVIATYAEQAKLIRKRLARRLRGSEKNMELLEKLEPRIATVDAFQGSEADTVIVSMTRSNKAGDIGFLDEERRLGVAVGRARKELYLVGDSKTVVQNNNNPESRAFFGNLHGLVGEHGQVAKEPWRPGGRKRRSHGSGLKRKQERSR